MFVIYELEIVFCLNYRCAPRLGEEAAALLSGQYVHIRNRVRETLAEKPGSSAVWNLFLRFCILSHVSLYLLQAVPITIRQLEALVRLSEALAKMRMSAEVSVADVQEALRLFKVSTLAASQVLERMTSLCLFLPLLLLIRRVHSTLEVRWGW